MISDKSLRTCLPASKMMSRFSYLSLCMYVGISHTSCPHPCLSGLFSLLSLQLPVGEGCLDKHMTRMQGVLCPKALQALGTAAGWSLGSALPSNPSAGWPLPFQAVQTRSGPACPTAVWECQALTRAQHQLIASSFYTCLVGQGCPVQSGVWESIYWTTQS